MVDCMLVKNLQQQLDRLFNQLADIEECREDLDDEEYEETRRDTLEQLKEFQATLDKATSGNVTMEDELSNLKLATQAAISDAFKTPEVLRLFTKQEPVQLRQALVQIERDITLGKRTAEDARVERMHILNVLKTKFGQELSNEEEMLFQDSLDLQKLAPSQGVSDDVLSLIPNKT